MLDPLPTQSQAGALAAETVQSYTVTLWQRARRADYGGYFHTVAELWKRSIGVARTVAWLLPLILFVALLVQSLNSNLMTIEGITVPDQLQKNGFTSEVASQRLHDVLVVFIERKKTTSMRSPEIRLHGNEPNLVVPGVGVSLDTIASAVRRFFHRDDQSVISGDLTLAGTQVWLRLRLNGKAFYDSEHGANLDQVDQLFDTAAQKIIWKIEPYLLASAAYDTDPDKAFDLADQIIRERPLSDENVSRANNLKAQIYLKNKKFKEALETVQKALDHPANWAVAALARNTKGYILLGLSNQLRDEAEKERDQTKARQSERFRSEAQQEFRAAIFYDPFYALAYINLGNVLHSLKDDEAARIVYDLAKMIGITNAREACTLANGLDEVRLHAAALEQGEVAKKFDASYVVTNTAGTVHCAPAPPVNIANAIPPTLQVAQEPSASNVSNATTSNVSNAATSNVLNATTSSAPPAEAAISN